MLFNSFGTKPGMSIAKCHALIYYATTAHQIKGQSCRLGRNFSEAVRTSPYGQPYNGFFWNAGSTNDFGTAADGPRLDLDDTAFWHFINCRPTGLGRVSWLFSLKKIARYRQGFLEKLYDGGCDLLLLSRAN